MKRKTAIALMLMALLCLCAAAQASVSATPKERLCLRTGPGTKYVELFSLGPSAKVRAIEYEKSHSTTWVLLEYHNKGKMHRSYTGLKRLTIDGSIPWADHIDENVQVLSGGQVFSAPEEEGGWRGRVEVGDWVTLLDYEDDYAYIEFTDRGTLSRGYVPVWMIDDDYDDDYDDDDDDYDDDYYDNVYFDDDDWDDDEDEYHYEGYGYFEDSYLNY